MHKYHIALGSNLGDRSAYLQQARTALQQLGSITRASEVMETEPFGAATHLFLNQMVEFKTELAPADLLDCLKTLETQLGRVPREHWGNREIDLDLILWSGGKLDTISPRGNQLTLPHLGFANRPFLQDLYASITG
jgi:2-amino-4-hydroxy-6-hydroxymethyldihydropteridine diphosphokinase